MQRLSFWYLSNGSNFDYVNSLVPAASPELSRPPRVSLTFRSSQTTVRNIKMNRRAIQNRSHSFTISFEACTAIHVGHAATLDRHAIPYCKLSIKSGQPNKYHYWAATVKSQFRGNLRNTNRTSLNPNGQLCPSGAAPNLNNHHNKNNWQQQPPPGK